MLGMDSFSEKPTIEIVDCARFQKFRYEGENRPGFKNQDLKFLTLKVSNLRGHKIRVRMFCVEDDKARNVHPNGLVGKHCHDGLFELERETSAATNTHQIEFPYIRIECMKQKKRDLQNIMGLLQKRASFLPPPWRERCLQLSQEPEGLKMADRSKVRLAVIVTSETIPSLPPLLAVTDIFRNLRADTVLKIERMGHSSSISALNGEVVDIFMSDDSPPIEPDKFEVSVTFKSDNPNDKMFYWESTVVPLKIWYQKVIEVRIPHFEPKPNTREPVKATLQVKSREYNYSSDPYPFQYVPHPDSSAIAQENSSTDIDSTNSLKRVRPYSPGLGFQGVKIRNLAAHKDSCIQTSEIPVPPSISSKNISWTTTCQFSPVTKNTVETPLANADAQNVNVHGLNSLNYNSKHSVGGQDFSTIIRQDVNHQLTKSALVMPQNQHDELTRHQRSAHSLNRNESQYSYQESDLLAMLHNQDWNSKQGEQTTFDWIPENNMNYDSAIATHYPIDQSTSQAPEMSLNQNNGDFRSKEPGMSINQNVDEFMYKESSISQNQTNKCNLFIQDSFQLISESPVGHSEITQSSDPDYFTLKPPSTVYPSRPGQEYESRHLNSKVFSSQLSSEGFFPRLEVCKSIPQEYFINNYQMNESKARLYKEVGVKVRPVCSKQSFEFEGKDSNTLTYRQMSQSKPTSTRPSVTTETANRDSSFVVDNIRSHFKQTPESYRQNTFVNKSFDGFIERDMEVDTDLSFNIKFQDKNSSSSTKADKNGSTDRPNTATLLSGIRLKEQTRFSPTASKDPDQIYTKKGYNDPPLNSTQTVQFRDLGVQVRPVVSSGLTLCVKLHPPVVEQPQHHTPQEQHAVIQGNTAKELGLNAFQSSRDTLVGHFGLDSQTNSVSNVFEDFVDFAGLELFETTLPPSTFDAIIADLLID